MVREKVLLYGLTLVADRPVLLGRLGEGVSFGGGTGSRSSVAAPGTLAGIAQGLVAAGAAEGSARRGDAERGLAPSTAIADALGAALGAAGEAEPAPADVGEAEDPASTAVTARELAREMFIRHALVGGEWRERHRFQQVNAERLEQARDVERRSRRMGLVAGEEALFAFFDDIVPEDVVSAGHFNGWWKRARRETPDLLVYPPGLLLPRGTGADPDAFPDHWASAGLRLALSYEFAPGSPRDGVTATVPVEVLPRVREDGADWLVPGMREELATGWIRALPKAKRRLLAPAPEVGAQVVAWIRGHVIGGGEASGREAAVPAPDGSVPTPTAGDPQSLDAAMARLARWGRASGQVVRATAPGRPDRQDAPARTPEDRQRGPVRTRGDEDGPGAPDATGPLPPFSRALAQAAAALRGVELSEADLAHAAGHLPDHLRMTFAVVDRHGAELGAGKDLAHLQRTLAGTADQAVRTAVRGAVAEAFADAEHRRRTSSPKGGGRERRSRGERIAGLLADGTAGQTAPPAAGVSPVPPPALEADGLTAFPAAALPRSLDTRDPATGLMLRGFPALVPQGDAAEPAAGIRILANPAEADQLHREGLARLLLLRVRLATARVTTRWTGREALMLAASPYGGTAALVADAQLASAVSLVDELTASPSSVREPQAFDRLAERARDLHEDRVHDLLGHVVRAMEALSEVQGAIREHPEVSLRAAVHDVEATTRSLIHPGFLLSTPPWALPHLARYLRAGAVRVRRASGGAPALRRDAEAMRTVHEVERAIDDAAERAAQRPFDAARAHALTQARWMAQELRVSLFAQQLGTPQKVSAKRVLGLIGAEAVRS
jgi:ATP-dependent helicase HrpA